MSRALKPGVAAWAMFDASISSRFDRKASASPCTPKYLSSTSIPFVLQLQFTGIPAMGNQQGPCQLVEMAHFRALWAQMRGDCLKIGRASCREGSGQTVCNQL